MWLSFLCWGAHHTARRILGIEPKPSTVGAWRRNHWTAGEFSKCGFPVVKEPDRTGPSFPGSSEHCPLQEAVGLSGFLSPRLPRSHVTCDLIATHAVVLFPFLSVCWSPVGPCCLLLGHLCVPLGQGHVDTEPRERPPPALGEIPVL